MARILVLSIVAIVVATGPRNAHAQELLVDADFDRLVGWTSIGPVATTLETRDVVQGCCRVRISNRQQAWNGVGQELLGRLVPGRSYRVRLWARVANAATAEVKVTLRRIDDAGTTYSTLAYGTAREDVWTRFDGAFTHRQTGDPSSLRFYVEGPGAGIDLIVDDASVTELEADWRAAADARIESIRRRDVRLEVQDADGCPLPGVIVRATQLRSRFGFGTAISHLPMGDQRYRDFIADNFDWAVMENAAKWRQNQWNPGPPDYANADLIAEFCRANGLRQRGHCIVWANEDRTPDWVTELTGEALRSAIDARFNDVVARYADDFEHWDVNNEMISNSFFADRLGEDVRPWMFDLAKAIDPDMVTMVNDYSIISDNRQTAIRQQVETIEAAGAVVDAIGVQGHFSAPPAGEVVLARLDNVAVAGKPIWITEFHVTESDPVVRAQALEDVYRAAFSHPSVEGILMWGFWAGAHFEGADASLIDLDWTINAAGERYLDLRDTWRTAVVQETDAEGAVGFRGYHGEYRVDVSLPGRVATFELTLEPGMRPEEIVLRVDASCERPCPADLDGDRVVSGSDLGLMLATWGGAGASDLDGDEDVDGADLGLLLASWGPCL